MHKVWLRCLGCSLLGVLLLAAGCQKSAPPPQTPSPQIPLPPPMPKPTANAAASTSPVPAAVPTVPQPAPTNPVPASGELTVSAVAEWDVPTPSNFSLPKPPSLQTYLSIAGGNQKEFLCAGNVRIDEALAGDQWLRVDVHESSSSIGELSPISRNTIFGKPDDPFSISLKFLYPGKPIEKISRLKGHFEVVTAGKVQTYADIKVTDLAKLTETDPTLKAVEATVVTAKQKFSDDLKYILKMGPSGVMTDIKLKDKDGRKSFKFAGGDYFPAGGSRHEGSLSADEANDLTISFTVSTELTRTTIPFDLSDIPVAPLKTPPPADLAQSQVFVASETNAALPKGLRIDGRFDWGRPWGGPGSKRSLLALIELSGPLARDIARLESTTVEKAISPDGELPWDKPSRSRLPVRSQGRGKFVTSEQGRPVSEVFRFDPKQPPQMCQELAGEFTALFVEDRQTITFTEFQNPTEGVLQHPELDKVGATLRYVVKKAEDRVTLDIVVGATDWAHLGGIDVFTSKGEPIMILDDNYYSGNEGTYPCVLTNEEFPPAKLEVEIYTKVRKEQFPYRFLNVPIPAFPK